MKLLRYAVACAAIAGLSTAQNEQNRLDLHRGINILWFLNDPYVTGDPVGGNYDADMYYKVYPGDQLQRCGGTSALVAQEYLLYDGDWVNDSTFPHMSYDNGVANGAGEITADPYDGVPIELPELQVTGFPIPSTCPSPVLSGARA